jgi:hypothetical protein
VTAATFEYMIRYIPVADETFGGTPIPIRYGLKITPPPSPRAPATKPPPNPSNYTYLNTGPLNTKSLLTKFTLSYFYLSFCSEDTILTAKARATPINTTKELIVIQSAAVHFLNTVFLQTFIAILMTSATPFKACFFHIQ